jgi:hypothetical protein
VISGSKDPEGKYMYKAVNNIFLNVNNGLPNPFPGNANAKPATPKSFKFNRAGRNGTLISVILDESGSMDGVRAQTISGFNELVQSQKSAENAGTAYLTLTKFDAPKVDILYRNVSIQEVKPLTAADYEPNGMTNLMDAVGQTMMSIQNVLGEVKEEERPGVLVVIMTDGYENSSTTYRADQIRSMVKQAEAADWSFMFLGADIDAFAAGSVIGMTAANTVSYNKADQLDAMHAVSASATAIRSAKMQGMDTHTLYASGTLTSGFNSKVYKNSVDADKE